MASINSHSNNNTSRIFFLYRFPAAIGFALLLSGSVVCLLFSVKFKNNNIYYLSSIIYLLSSFLFIKAAMAREKNNLMCSSRILLGFSSILIVLCFFDLYILNFRHDSSGPGGAVITHRNWYKTFVSNNEYGFWDRNIADFETPDDERFVIAVVGDSFAWGQGIKGKEYRFTEQLENKLKSVSAKKKIAILNFGRGGADTLAETKIIREFVSKIHPDMVVICYLSNDIETSHLMVGTKQYNTFTNKLSLISPTLNFFYWRWLGPMKYQNSGLTFFANIVEAYRNPESFRKHTDDIQVMIEDVRKIGAEPVFVLMPFPSMWAIFRKDVRELVYTNIRHAVSESGTPLIDLTYIEDKYSVKEFQVNPMDAHPNERMHEKFAETIYKWLVENRSW
ncbi:MAG: hypothetical protein GY749_27835 [Desulfobacteraceae bacterium]|nr:hypothetical protein [Desulfobacteraceae bacterium]